MRVERIWQHFVTLFNFHDFECFFQPTLEPWMAASSNSIYEARGRDEREDQDCNENTVGSTTRILAFIPL